MTRRMVFSLHALWKASPAGSSPAGTHQPRIARQTSRTPESGKHPARDAGTRLGGIVPLGSRGSRTHRNRRRGFREHHARQGRYEGIVARPQKYETYVRQLRRQSAVLAGVGRIESGLRPPRVLGCRRHRPPLAAFRTQLGARRPAQLQESRRPFPDRLRCLLLEMVPLRHGARRAARPSAGAEDLLHLRPLGTTLFIPGYWSFDANRDLREWRSFGSKRTWREPGSRR